EDDLWGGVVPPALALLLALPIGDVPEHDARLVRVGELANARELAGGLRLLVEDERRDHEQRIKPTARLIDRFADEIGRKGGVEARLRPFDVREPPLRERHAPRIEPA